MKREANLARLSEPFDVLVIGGGATGLGCAVDAASRGYRTALVEAGDFAGATSSRSTKILHGGVRYLEQGDVKLVREALHERVNVLRNASHLSRALGFLCPFYKWFEAPYYFAGLKAYDVLAGSASLGASRYLGRFETVRRLPNLRGTGLHGGILYFDGLFDDARLALALARTAVDCGAAVVNYARAVRLLRDGSRVAGALVRDQESGVEREVRARVVVNATGIFTDDIRELEDSSAPPLMKLSRGSHLVFPRELFPGDDALLVPKTEDGRVLFAIPWHEHVVVGTTDIEARAPELDPQPTRAEIDFIVAQFNRYLARKVARHQAVAAFAGLRPLVSGPAASTAKLSREHYVGVSAGSMVTVAGGKWTTYRKMAEDAIDVAAKTAGLEPHACVTPSLALHGNPTPGEPDGADAYAIYGTDAARIRAIEAADPTLAQALQPGFAHTRAAVLFAAREEMARTVDDVLSRRTRMLFLDAAGARRAAPEVAALLARELGRDGAWVDAQVRAFDGIIDGDNAALLTA
jgi:glycerol-3-phosphate dehydrogenase